MGGNGSWNGSSCYCDNGWQGDNCSEEEPESSEPATINNEPEETATAQSGEDHSCSGHGSWTGSSCSCESGYVGSDCDKTVREACANHGVWISASGYGSAGGYCSCDDGYGGYNCSQSACTSNTDCGGNNSGYYCKITSFSPISGGCYPRGNGGDFSSVTLPDGVSVVYASNKYMNWFAAEQYCAAHGMNRASKNLFTGSNEPNTTTNALYNAFNAAGRSGVWYWLDEGTSSSVWGVNVASGEYIYDNLPPVLDDSGYRVLCVH